MTEPHDELLECYADAAARDPRRPSTRVREAAFAHAQMQLDPVKSMQLVRPRLSESPASNQSRWLRSLVASLAVVGIVGLLYVQFYSGPSDSDQVAVTSPTPSDVHPSTIVTDAGNVPTATTPPAVQTNRLPDASQRPDKPSAPATALAKTESSGRKQPPVKQAPVQESGQHMAKESPADTVWASSASAGAEATMSSTFPTVDNSASATQHAAHVANADAVAPKPSLLLNAARNGQIEMMERLLSQGVAINSQDSLGNTALMVAVRYRQLGVARKLLERGADRSVVNNNGETALQLANRLHRGDFIKLLDSPP